MGIYKKLIINTLGIDIGLLGIFVLFIICCIGIYHGFKLNQQYFDVPTNIKDYIIFLIPSLIITFIVLLNMTFTPLKI